MAKRLPCKECGMLTKHYDSRGGVSLICSECGTVAPVYRVNRPAPPPSATTDLFDAPRPVPASGTVTGEDRPRYIGSEDGYGNETGNTAAQRQLVLDELKWAAAHGWVYGVEHKGKHHLAPAGCVPAPVLNDICYRYSARIHELRQEGYDIERLHVAGQIFAYRLRSAEGRAAA